MGNGGTRGGGGRVIPADLRGSCCFLLGILTVTFHGASHAGITNKSSLSVEKNHPGFFGELREGGLISEQKLSGKSSLSNWLVF